MVGTDGLCCDLISSKPFEIQLRIPARQVERIHEAWVVILQR